MSNDVIYRSDAIKAVWKPIVNPNAVIFDALKRAIESEISNIPSAQPERKKGEWEMKPDPYGFFDEIPVCSECGCTTKMRETYNFCPNCGARMKGADDEV